MGGQAGSQEDMFAKLDSMRSVITEVNTQFKDPVSFPFFPSTAEIQTMSSQSGKDNIRLRLHFRISLLV